MKNIIFYFTGTGNSLDIAQNLAKEIGDTELVPVTDKLQAAGSMNFERIGFVFPVHYYSVPAIVERFIKKMSFEKAQYVFGVAIYGGLHGAVMGHLRTIISSQGGILSGEFGIQMPGSNITSFNALPIFLQKNIINRSKRKTQIIVDTVLSKISTKKIKPEFFSKLDKEKASNERNEISEKAKYFNSNEKCTKCGICQKICPVDNINIIDGKPLWANKCELCLACIQWCLQQAINYGDKTKKRKRYQNPHIKIVNMLKKTNTQISSRD
jgi:ferredoxin/flavodoxin